MSAHTGFVFSYDRPRRIGATQLLAVFAVLLAAALALPVVVVLVNVLLPSQGTWRHLAQTVLGSYIHNTVWLLIGVAIGVFALGVATAWLTTMCEFPGRRVFEWASVLPLAVPAYVMAYAYTDFLQVSGPFQSWLRELTGWGMRDYWFPDVRSLGGAILLLSLVLYPYVYLLTRTAFLEQSGSMLEVARISGYGPWRTFLRVALPLARPGIVAGVTLALMETLADFGTVSYFGVQTFTTGIYRAWFSLGDRIAAAQLAATLLGFVVAVLLLERLSRGRRKFTHKSGRRRLYSYRLRGFPAVAAFMACLAPLALGFILPAGILLQLALTSGDAQFGMRYLELTFNTVTLAAIAASLAVTCALFVAYAARLARSPVVLNANRVAGLGYAVPGVVIAVGVLIPVSRLDNVLASWLQGNFGVNPGLILTGSIAALVYAYLVRFFTIALQAVDAGLTRITPSMDDAARSLGRGPLAVLRQVHAPLMWSSVFSGGLLAFVDVMKELPVTFVMRPFNFDTLAVQAFNLASDERLAEASTASLTIVAVGLLPLIVMSRTIVRDRR